MRKIACLQACLLLVALWALPLQAQEAENDGAAVIVMMKAKAGHEAELVDAITEYHQWIGDKEGAMRFTWYAVETGSRSGWFAARSGDHNWADFDQEHDWDDEAEARFLSDVAPHIDQWERSLTEDMPEFSNLPDDWSGVTHFQVEHWHIKSGQYGAWRSHLETIHKALTEGGFNEHWGIHTVVSGGKANQVAIVFPMKGYADFANPEPSFYSVMSEALGGPEAFGQFMAEWGATYHAGETFLVRYLPEASDYGDSE